MSPQDRMRIRDEVKAELIECDPEKLKEAAKKLEEAKSTSEEQPTPTDPPKPDPE